MAQVFISHAHRDEELARKIAGLLGDALALPPTDFFLSSQEGRGVAPSANIRSEVLKAVAAVPALIVLLTPNSAGSPWVWLEAGSRFAEADRTKPLFVVPSGRFVPLLQPVADMRSLRLDSDGELHELVRAVAGDLGKPPADYLVYKPALAELTASAARAYPAETWVARAVGRLKRHAPGLVVGLALATGAATVFFKQPTQPSAIPSEQLSKQAVESAAPYLIFRGKVVSKADDPIEGASVIVSNVRMHDKAACEAQCPSKEDCRCTWAPTGSDGKFSIGLTRIGKVAGEDVMVSIVKEGFTPDFKTMRIDSRVMDSDTGPYTVKLKNP